MQIHHLEYRCSFGGRASAQKWTYGFFVQTQYQLNAPETKTAVTTLGTWLKDAHMPQVHFTSCHATHKADNVLNRPGTDFKTFNVEGVGTRTSLAKPLPLSICLDIQKEAELNHGGLLALRGALTFDEVTENSENDFTLLDDSYWTGNEHLCGRLKLGIVGFQFILPNKAGLIMQTGRLVTDWTIAGISIRKLNRNRRSIAAEQENLNQRKLNDFAKRAHKLLKKAGDNPLSGNALSVFTEIVHGALDFFNGLSLEEKILLELPAVLALPAGV